MRWRHDGSFTGFLSACFRIFETKDASALLVGPGDADDLFAEAPVEVAAEEELARRVWRGLARMGGHEAAAAVRDAFLNRDPEGSGDLLGFVRRVVDHGPAALDRLADPPVRETLRRAQAVRREAHLLTGFLRFRRIEHDVSWYAAFRPDHDVLALLVPHFRDRMGERSWMIHDTGRSQAALCRGGQLEHLQGLVVDEAPPEEAEEGHYQELWKEFFRRIAVEERRNPRLQRSHLPKKYWAYLVEEPGCVLRA